MCSHVTCVPLRVTAAAIHGSRGIPYIVYMTKKAGRLIIKRPACAHVFLCLSLPRRCLEVTRARGPG